MLYLVKLFLAFMIVVTSGLAREADFKDHLKWVKENLEKTQKKGAALQQGEKDASSCPSQKCQIKNLQTPPVENHTSQENPAEPQDKILVFVSFSMPEASLKALAQDAERHSAVLIIRGLIEDSFKVTAEHLKDYAQGVEINPELFEKYNIQHVPTFVKIKKDEQEQARLSGNVTLAFAAQKLGESS